MAIETLDAAAAQATTNTPAVAGSNGSTDAGVVASDASASDRGGSSSSLLGSSYGGDGFDPTESTLDIPERGQATKRRSDIFKDGAAKAAKVKQSDVGDDGNEITEAAGATAEEESVAATLGTDESTDAEAASTKQTDAGKEPAAGIDQTLVELAEWYGFTAEDAKSFGSSDALRRALTALDRRELSARQQSQQTQQVEGDGKTGAESKVAAEASAEKQTQQATAETKQSEQAAAKVAEANLTVQDFEPIALDLEGWDEETAGVLKGLADKANSSISKFASRVTSQATEIATTRNQLAQLQQHIEALEQHRQQIEGERFEQELDGYFGGVGEEYSPIFGKGAGRELKPDSAELKSRHDLVKEMFALRETDQRLGRSEMTRPQLFKRALAIKFFDKTKELARNQLSHEAKDRKEQAVARPTQRRSPALTGDRAAAERANQFYKDRGMDPGPSLYDDDELGE